MTANLWLQRFRAIGVRVEQLAQGQEQDREEMRDHIARLQEGIARLEAQNIGRAKTGGQTLERVEHLHTKVDLVQGAVDRSLDKVREALGRVEGRQTEGAGGQARDGWVLKNEFRVFSQWGEDGIIQHLIRHVPITRPLFVEFGVETYVESNTRFLLVNNNWSGVVFDGSPENVARIRENPLYWQYNLKAQAAFITRENINDLLREQGVTGSVGLLSVDIDGNDYWVWEAIEVVEPAIVVVEYNHRFGAQASVTVPYAPAFVRSEAHHSTVYFGASLTALCRLAARKGYDFVGCGTNGVNAFFVRSEMRPDTIPRLTPQQGFRPGLFCEYHNEQGVLTKQSHQQEIDLLATLPLVSVE